MASSDRLPSVLVWTGLIATGVGWNINAHRRGIPLLCHVARNPVGFALYVAFGFHLFVKLLDPVHRIANLYRRLT